MREKIREKHAVLQFDEKRHTVTMGSKSAELSPLSYRLLAALAEQPEQVFSVADLIDKVWINAQVSPETLKQRVFVLRKAIDEVGFDGISIQAVRGEGYRLLITHYEASIESSVVSIESEFSEPAHFKRNFRGLTFLSVVCAVAMAFTTFWFFIRTSDHTINNRVLLWSNLPSEHMPVEGRTAFETWRSLVAKESIEGQLQLVLSDRMNNMLVPVQARRDRAGLISNFELINTHEGHSARLSIVEPRTATVLRSDVIDLSNQIQLNQILNAQFVALNELIFSHRLCLTKDQRENSQAPIWQELRKIANQT